MLLDNDSGLDPWAASSNHASPSLLAILEGVAFTGDIMLKITLTLFLTLPFLLSSVRALHWSVQDRMQASFETAEIGTKFDEAVFTKQGMRVKLHRGPAFPADLKAIADWFSGRHGADDDFDIAAVIGGPSFLRYEYHLMVRDGVIIDKIPTFE